MHVATAGRVLASKNRHMHGVIELVKMQSQSWSRGCKIGIWLWCIDRKTQLMTDNLKSRLRPLCGSEQRIAGGLNRDMISQKSQTPRALAGLRLGVMGIGRVGVPGIPAVLWVSVPC